MLPERKRRWPGGWRIERRPAPAPWMRWASPVLALLLTALIAAVLFAMLGKNPWQGLAVFFVEPLRNAYAQFRAQGIQNIIVDFRYNGGGLVDIAVHLASLIGGTRTSGQVLLNYVHNDRVGPTYNKTIRFTR